MLQGQSLSVQSLVEPLESLSWQLSHYHDVELRCCPFVVNCMPSLKSHDNGLSQWKGILHMHRLLSLADTDHMWPQMIQNMNPGYPAGFACCIDLWHAISAIAFGCSLIFYHFGQNHIGLIIRRSQDILRCSISITLASHGLHGFTIRRKSFVVSNNKGSIKCITGPLTGGFPSQRASNTECFPYRDVILHTSHTRFIWNMFWNDFCIALGANMRYNIKSKITKQN